VEAITIAAAVVSDRVVTREMVAFISGWLRRVFSP
jgi:hypothetical protein